MGEKKIHEERSKEGSEFADKEEFVTSAYKKKMEELKRLEAEERLQEAKDAAADEMRKKDGFRGFYRHILDARTRAVVAGGAEEKVGRAEEKVEEKAEEKVEVKEEEIEKEEKREREYRAKPADDGN